MIDEPANNVILLPNVAPPRTFRSFQMTREGLLWLIAAVIMFVTGIYKGINLLILLSYLLVGLWLVNLRLVQRDLLKIRGRRLPSEPIVAGKAQVLQMELTLVGRRGTRGVTVEEHGSAHAHRWMILRLPEKHPLRIRYSQVIEQRGRYAVSPLYARSQFPFGLVGRQAMLAPAVEWIVLPRMGLLRVERLKRWLSRSTRGDGRVRARQRRPSLTEAEIHGLREFRPGDSPRWIHWRSTARRNQVLVREFEEAAQPELVLIVEPWLPPEAIDRDRERLEKLISMAATIGQEWCRDSTARLTLIVASSAPMVLPPGTGLEYARRALELLAVEEGGVTADFRSWSDRWPRLRQSTPLLLLTSRTASPLTDEIAAHMGQQVGSVDADDVLEWYEASKPS